MAKRTRISVETRKRIVGQLAGHAWADVQLALSGQVRWHAELSPLQRRAIHREMRRIVRGLRAWIKADAEEDK